MLRSLISCGLVRPVVCGLLVAALGSLAQAQPVLITAPQTVGPEQTEITPTAGGDPVPLATAEITVRGTTLTMNGRHQIASLVVEPDTATAGVVTHGNAFSFDYAGDGSDVVNGLYLMVSGDVLIDANSRLDVSARGHAGGAGPGAGQSGVNVEGGGGGYGGNGGGGGLGAMPGGVTYGDLYFPADFGSGGGNASGSSGGAPVANSGGAGGGLLHLIVSGLLQVDGQILADGGDGSRPFYRAGGGSGGSILIECGTMSGSGIIGANGGAGNSQSGSARAGGGGGGRIAVYTCDQQLSLSSIFVNGGTGFEAGDPGTIYFGSGTVTIIQQPEDAHGVAGGGLLLQTAAVTSQPDGQLQYQWRKKDEDGAFLPLIEGQGGGRYTGVETPALAIADTTCGDSGEYDCLVTDSCGGFPARAATVIVVSPVDFNEDGVLDLADIIAFVSAFTTQDPAADLAEPFGVLDLADVISFVTAFLAGCP